jgi:DNA-binding NtrC family response regulator
MASTRSLQRWFKQFKEVGRCVIGKSTGRPSKSATQLAAIKIKMKYRKNTKKRVSKVTKQLNILRTTFRRRLKQLDLKAIRMTRNTILLINPFIW